MTEKAHVVRRQLMEQRVRKRGGWLVNPIYLSSDNESFVCQVCCCGVSRRSPHQSWAIRTAVGLNHFERVAESRHHYRRSGSELSGTRIHLDSTAG